MTSIRQLHTVIFVAPVREPSMGEAVPELVGMDFNDAGLTTTTIEHLTDPGFTKSALVSGDWHVRRETEQVVTFARCL